VEIGQIQGVGPPGRVYVFKALINVIIYTSPMS